MSTSDVFRKDVVGNQCLARAYDRRAGGRMNARIAKSGLRAGLMAMSSRMLRIVRAECFSRF